ncbi:MAG: epoxyqueuosine reductase [Bacillota bacterium]
MKELIEENIKNFIKEYGKNENVETQWGEPLVAYAYAQDQLFDQLKELVSSTHALPGELVSGAKTVITYFIPFEKQVTLSNGGSQVSREWALAYVETNMLIIKLNEYMHAFLNSQGFNSAILPPTHNFNTENLLSDWSHKHVAYISGLGKFGLHQMLITEKGTCGRLGSIVTDLQIEPTSRDDKEYCLYKYNNTCKRCVEKCITGALQELSFDRHKCYDYLLEVADQYVQIGLADVCGKCVHNVPCSFIRPVKDK